jgi:membrane-associated phospholipid phosphatase
VPSLHAAYMLIATIYAVLSKQSKILIILFAIITMGIWWTAVYSTHHYIIDVLLGIGVAIFGILLFEQVLMRIPAFARFMHSYERYI